MKIISVLWLTVLCVGCGGYGSSTKVTPPQPGAVPAIAQLAPNTVTAGAPGFTLTVNGSNFAGNSVVNWGSATPSTTFVTGKQLMTAIPASMIGRDAILGRLRSQRPFATPEPCDDRLRRRATRPTIAATGRA